MSRSEETRVVLGPSRFEAPTLHDTLSLPTARIISGQQSAARRVLSSGQRLLAGATAALLIVGLCLWPTATMVTMVGLCTGLFLASIGARSFYALVGWRLGGAIDASELPLPKQLPRYTILVALYREANVAARLVQGLRALDYPADKLEVIFLVESDDQETEQALRACSPSEWSVVVVPEGSPKTKPRALNWGLQRASGQLLTIFDAEDRPEPDQLLKAVAAFSALPENVVALQARLDFFNASENLLSRLFTCDYATHFGPYLDGLAQLQHPVPLGGTSTHFRTDAIRRLGGWDAWNVTEDCDLGMRIAAQGYTTRTLDSTTWEEAVAKPGAWIRQRSRWIKGFAQTGLVLLRTPRQRRRTMGTLPYLSSLLTVASVPIGVCLQLVFWLILGLYGLGALTGLEPNPIKTLFPLPLELIGGICLLVGNLLVLELALAAVYQQRRYALVRYALLMPAYWLLASVAAWKALGQLIGRPHYWEKTAHGVCRESAEPVFPKLAKET